MSDVLEITVFGKGQGESILVGLDNEKYIVIDSFIESESGRPVALKYMEDNGIGINKIIGVICTHWDNDHIRGIGDIISEHPAELNLCLPSVLSQKTYTQYISSFDEAEDESPSSELCRILDLYQKKKCQLSWVIQDRILLENEMEDRVTTMRALSPSDEQYSMFLNSIVPPQKGQTIRKPLLKDNVLSIVTHIESSIDSVLLGGDLELSPYGGWSYICDRYKSISKCHIFKIPHHGSKNGYHSDVWGNLVENPISIITRFNNKSLPSEEMVKKIKKTSSIVYVVGAPSRKSNSLKQEINKHMFGSMVKSARENS